MDRLRPDQLRPVRALAGAERHRFVLDAMIAGNTTVQAWTDSATEPAAALVWDGGHCVWLLGVVEQPKLWREVLAHELLPAIRGLVKVDVAAGDATAVIGDHEFEPADRVLYRYDRSSAVAPSLSTPDGYRISPISQADESQRSLENVSAVMDELQSCWSSLSRFASHGFGFVAHDAGRIVCWCTAEYVSDRSCGIGIETVEAEQGRGFATSTAAAFVSHCRDRRITPYWDSWAGNAPSVAVARRLGFTLVEEYVVRVAVLGDDNP